ncbi:hypothetical protein EC973_007255 [Apophysomyces ossiformis]|uniref:Uncharacterized protein n=1 Tax=Apophysomyces ossiformis TaxID=679940 RepID=A0A8H7BS94_9FUNG|nr:hypothetical protein EC973_007255 [Apophysomyces ossiformis]
MTDTGPQPTIQDLITSSGLDEPEPVQQREDSQSHSTSEAVKETPGSEKSNSEKSNGEKTLLADGDSGKAKEGPTIPGAYTGSIALPDWYRVGWTAFSTLPNPGDEQGMTEFKDMDPAAVAEIFKGSRAVANRDNDIVAQYLKDSYYGEWYHNAGVFILTVLMTWLLTCFGAGLSTCLIIGAFLGTYYQTSIRRVRRNARDDIQRELMTTRLETDIESADWINHFLSRFWLIFEPALSAQIIGIADAILVENTPSFLDSIRLSTFTLGTKGPRIEGIKTYPRTEPNIVCMDWKLSFTPNDILDLSHRDLQSKINPKIVLSIRVGKGMIGAGMPVLLEDLAFSANMRLRFKLFNEFPHVKTVEASFLEKPQFDYVLKPVGGETFGFDINNIPGLQTFVEEQVHATLGPMMYAPNVYTVDVAAMMAGTDLDAANGVLAITVYSAHGLKGTDMFGSLDPYITFHSGNVNNPELGRTSAFENTTNPKWNETYFLLLNNLNDEFYVRVMDRNTGRKDSEIGVANFDLKELEEANNVVDGLNMSVLRSGKVVGEVKCDLRYFPAARPEKQEDGTIIPPPESESGILRFTVHECKEIGGAVKKGGLPGIGGLPVVGGLPIVGSGGSDIDAYAVVRVNGQEKLRTKTFKRSVNPRWDKYVEVFVPDKSQLDLGVNILNEKEFGEDEILGRWSSPLKTFEDDITNRKMDWWTLKDGTGRVHLSMQWKPVIMTGFSEGLGHGAYRPPIGVVRLHFAEAKELKNVEALTGGKSDPYVRVLAGMQVRGQTDVILDDLDPVWNSSLYVPVHSLREDLIFQVMDYNDISKDKILGLHDFILKDIVKETVVDGQTIYVGLDPVDRWVDLTSNERKKGKGRLHYTASFYPILELPKEEEEKEETGEEITEQKEESEKQVDGVIPADKTLPERDLHGELIKYTEDKKIDLLAYESGILAVTIHDVKLPERMKVTTDILLDSNDPQYRTSQAKGIHLPFNETGDAFVKEMEFSRLVVRVKAVKDNDKDDSHVGYYSRPVRDIVRALMNEDNSEPKSFDLLECPGGSVRLNFKFTPVIQFKLDPSESMENQGMLTATVLRAKNLKAMDRSGTSDPYVVFKLNGKEVYKTEVYKKQLNPVFKDEKFSAPVLQRIGAKLEAIIYDWDQFGGPDLLAQGDIIFTSDTLESFAAKEFEVPMTEGATLTIRLLWQPQLIARQRQGTSLLSATTRMFTSVPGTALGAGGKVIGTGLDVGGKVLGTGGRVVGGGVSAIGGGVSAIGSGIGSGIRGIGRLGRKSGGSEVSSTAGGRSSGVIPEEVAVEAPQVPVAAAPASTVPASAAPAPVAPTGQVPVAQPQTINDVSPRASLSKRSIFTTGADDAVNVKISIIAGRNLKGMNRDKTSDPYARVRIGKHVVHKTRHIKKTCEPEWNDVFTTKISQNQPILEIKVKDHNTFSDVDIGDAVFNMGDHLGSGQAFDGWLPLVPEGNGEIRIRVEAI